MLIYANYSTFLRVTQPPWHKIWISSFLCPKTFYAILDAHLWHHCRQLGDFLRVAGGVGSDATAEAVDGRAKAMQLYDIKVMSGP